MRQPTPAPVGDISLRTEPWAVDIKKFGAYPDAEQGQIL
jgi:hypothetical protein